MEKELDITVWESSRFKLHALVQYCMLVTDYKRQSTCTMYKITYHISKNKKKQKNSDNHRLINIKLTTYTEGCKVIDNEQFSEPENNRDGVSRS